MRFSNIKHNRNRAWAKIIWAINYIRLRSSLLPILEQLLIAGQLCGPAPGEKSVAKDKDS